MNPINSPKHQTTRTVMKQQLTRMREPLPLDWTQISRKRKSPSGESFYCCELPECEHPSLALLNNDHNRGIPTVSMNNSKNANDTNDERQQTIRGKAIFCLHDLDCTWFQGHFLPLNDRISSSSLGLLAVNRMDVDECLQCQDGGYREIDLMIVSSRTNKKNRRTTVAASSNSSNSNGTGTGTIVQRRNGGGEEQKKLQVERVVCTGGDMICMKSEDTAVSFDAERVITGVKVVPLVERYFKSLLKSARKVGAGAQNDDDEEEKKDDMRETSVLELLPHCAVVIGTMELNVPQSFLSDNKDSSSDKENDDDGWIST